MMPIAFPIPGEVIVWIVGFVSLLERLVIVVVVNGLYVQTSIRIFAFLGCSGRMERLEPYLC